MTRILSPAGMALVALNLLLVLVFIYELSAPQPELEVPKLSAHRTVPRVSAAEYVPPPAEAYAEIDNRPMFLASRRLPKIAEASTGAALLPPPTVTLVGIIAGGQSRVALVKSQLAPGAVTVTVGSKIDGWEVTAIEPDRIVLHSGAADYEVRLRPPPGGPAVAMVPGGGTSQPSSPVTNETR